MPEQDKRTPATDAVNALASFLSEPPLDDNIEGIEARLKQAGVNTKRILDLTQQHLDQAKNRQRLRAAKQRREALLAQIQQVRQHIKTGSSNALGKVKQLLDVHFGDTPEAAVLYRKFETASPEDLECLLEDVLFLDQIESASPDDRQS
jgi:hypothetical protein